MQQRIKLKQINDTDIDFAEAKRFLEWLDPEAKTFTFQTFDDDKKRRNPKLSRIMRGSFAECRNELADLNRKGAGVFVSVDATDGNGRKEENIVEVRAVCVDLDGAPIDPVRECSLRPQIEVESSPGRYHAYWLVRDFDPNLYVRVQYAVAESFDGDPSIAKITHIGRLPGFLHMKDKPFRTSIVGDHDADFYSQRNIERVFPPIDTPHKPPSSRPLLDPEVPIESAKLFIKRHYLPEGNKPGVFGVHYFRGRYYRWVGTHYESVEDTTVRKQLYTFLHSGVARKKGVSFPSMRLGLKSVWSSMHLCPEFTSTQNSTRRIGSSPTTMILLKTAA